MGSQVKRKDPPEAAAVCDNKRARPSTPVDDELEDEGNFLLGLQTPLYKWLFFCFVLFVRF